MKIFGYNISLYVEKIKSDKSLVSEKVSDYIAVDIARCLKIKNTENLKENSKFFAQPWLFISYIIVKCLYGASIIFQIWFMSYIFQDEYYRKSNIGFFETSLTIEERFPRVIFCKSTYSSKFSVKVDKIYFLS